MTRPRYITKGMAFYVTVRGVNRSFRFVPKRRVKEAIDYCLAVVLGEYRRKGKLALHEFKFMSNHYHLLGTDKVKCLPDFIRDLNALISRELNAIRGISGTNIEKGYNLVRIESAGRTVEHAVYTLVNAVRANLVAKARDWKGTSSVRMAYGVPVVVCKPKVGLWAGKEGHAKRAASQRSKRAAFAGRSKLPRSAELVIDRPEIMPHLSDEELRALILRGVKEKESVYAAERKQRGIGVVGWARVVARHYLSIPTETEELFGVEPTISASSKKEREAAAEVMATFEAMYYRARDLFVAGCRSVRFPEGTWEMWRRFKVGCEPVLI